MTYIDETSTMQLNQATAALDKQRHRIRRMLDAAEYSDEEKHLNEALERIKWAQWHLENAAQAENEAAEIVCRNL